MKLSDHKSSYYDHTASASSVARQIAFAGIAFIWIFKRESTGSITLPTELLWPAILLILGLTSDLLQYFSASAIWGVFHRTKEKQGIKQNEEIQASIYLNWPSLAFFWIKLFSITIGNILILSYALKKIAFT